MIITSCPLRVSLAGGSTDLQDFIDHHGFGSVISFSSTVRTYITIHENNRGKYIVNCARHEERDSIDQIYNDIVRIVLEEYYCPPVTITFNTDIHTSGSGLASSTSYLICLIKAVLSFKKIEKSDFEICKLALKLERKFNNKTGYQDPYGCGMPSLKKMTFDKRGNVDIRYFDHTFLNSFDMYLIWTGVSRSSTTVLNKASKPIIDRTILLDQVKNLEKCILNYDYTEFYRIINDGWKNKKNLFPYITQNERVKKIDSILLADQNILAHRLCGAGNGGYFLTFVKKGYKINHQNSIMIGVYNEGIVEKKI